MKKIRDSLDNFSGGRCLASNLETIEVREEIINQKSPRGDSLSVESDHSRKLTGTVLCLKGISV